MRCILISLIAFALVIVFPRWGESARLTVSAAASLEEAFQEIARRFQDAHPEHRVSLNLASSGHLQRQIERGAPVDVFASASPRPMDALEKEGLIQPASRNVMARNRLVLIASKGAAIRSFSDLGKNFQGWLAVGNPRHVPAGFYSKEVLEWLGYWARLSSNRVLAENVLQVLEYVATGEADAGLVYRTDALRDRYQVKLIDEAPAGSHAPIEYPIAVVAGSRSPEASKAFVDFVLSSPAQAALAQAGFEPVRSTGTGRATESRSGSESVGNRAWFSTWLSIWVALVSTFIVAVVGTTLAYLLARRNFFGKNILHILLTLPLVLPPTVTGYYLINILGRYGVLGGPLYEWTGWTVAFTWWAAVLASTVVSLPFMLQTGRAAIESVDRNVEYASQLLGKGEWRTALTITIPLARRGLIAGLVLSFARAMGEFGATLMLAGNIPGRTNTMPLEIYSAFLAGDLEQAQWLVVAHTSISFLALFFATRWSRERVKVGC